MTAPSVPRAGVVSRITSGRSDNPGEYRTARSVFGSKSTTLAAWRTPLGVSISTLLDPATTWALVTKYPGASGHDDPASAPPSHPEAMTLEVTLTASRIPGVFTSGGI